MSDAKKTVVSETGYTPESTNDIQRDLENQLRQFGASVAKGMAEGFEDGGAEIGKRAVSAGSAFASTVAQEYASVSKKQWANTAVAKPTAAFEKAVAARTGVGIAQVLAGGLLGVPCTLAMLICALTGGLLGGLAGGITGAVAVFLGVIGVPLLFVLRMGVVNLNLSQRMKHYAACAASCTSISFDALAEKTGYALPVVRKDIQKMLKNEWCALWLEQRGEVLHFTLASYKAAMEQAQAAIAAAQPAQSQPAQGKQLTLLQSMEQFIALLAQQSKIMNNEQAQQELAYMQTCCRDMLDWLKAHPESESKMRRFSSYYMPTTMKLLYTYNDVQGQQGENAQQIRQDIAGFLHTLNIAFDNLHDSLLSAASMDVSAEIAALQGMLAQDGLSKKDGVSGEISLE